MPEEMKPTYLAADLFAGIGGIRLGFEQAFGDSIITNLVCEIDEKAQETYQAMFHQKEILGDITTIDLRKVKKFQICLAGFPCQAFSMAGKRGGFKDNHNGINRGRLFFEVIRICKSKKPMVIFCENVKGLIHHNGGKTIKKMKDEFEKIGYEVEYTVLNSKDFGVPQNRERLYIVAFRHDIGKSGFSFPEPQGKKVTIGDILEKEIVDTKYYMSSQYLKTLKKHKKRQESRGNGFGYAVRRHKDTGGALVCGGMGRERNLIVDKKRKTFEPTTNIRSEVNKEHIRRLTPRECARLQGFPDDFPLVVADTHLYNQFGNSVTVPVIKAIAVEIKKKLDDHLANGGEKNYKG